MESSDSLVSRRTMLAGATTGLTAALTGCESVRGWGRKSSPVSVLAAGSLQLALIEGLEAAVDHEVQVESHGSVTVARMVAEGQHDPDIVALADLSLFDAILDVPWYTAYASNEIVVAYNPETVPGRRVGTASHWYTPFVEGEATLGRTDPELDPLGYRTLFMLRLAGDYYEQPDLADDILQGDQIYPETELLSHFETGALDAAIVYRNMAVERDYEYVKLPEQISLRSPANVDDWYSRVSYTLPEGRKIRGDLISYGATVPSGHLDTDTRDVFRTLISGGYLQEHGFNTPASYPTHYGHVPNSIPE